MDIPSSIMVLFSRILPYDQETHIPNPLFEQVLLTRVEPLPPSRCIPYIVFESQVLLLRVLSLDDWTCTPHRLPEQMLFLRVLLSDKSRMPY